MGLKQGVTLYQHQSELRELARTQPRWGVFFEPGTGKSLTLLSIIADRLDAAPKYKTLIVCPATLVPNWYDEVRKHTDLYAEMLLGERVKRTRILENTGAHVYIINYEGARILWSELIRKHFDMLVCDEIHACKDPFSLQSKKLAEISKHINSVYGLTGTSILNTPLDLWGQMRIIDPALLGPSFYRFRAHHAVMGGFLGKQVVKYVNLDKLKAKILTRATIKLADECLDLPPRVYQKVQLELPSEQKIMYDSLKESFYAEFQGKAVTAPIVLTRLIRFSQITAGFCKNTEGEEVPFKENPKLDWLVSWCKEFQKKIVVFVRFVKEVELVERGLADAGITYATLSGKTVNRMDVVRQFNSDAGVQVLVGQIDVAGTGLNLTAAQYAMFLTNSYSYGARRQCEDRIRRIGQTAAHCIYIDLFYRATIDQTLLKTLSRKESLSKLLSESTINIV